ncbi:MAG: HepT-like ribonuclease domain-containing protein [Actinomycetota bacterium]|jgi:uncharacterized protein with HEPN domain
MTRSAADRLQDIIARIAAIDIAEGLLHSTVEGVAQTAFDAILYDLMVIGEAVKNLPDEMRVRHSDIPWTDIARMRDLLAHVYFRVREATVRSTIDAPLADLRAVCADELAVRRR